jgi:hypothetical protein
MNFSFSQFIILKSFNSILNSVIKKEEKTSNTTMNKSQQFPYPNFFFSKDKLRKYLIRTGPWTNRLILNTLPLTLAKLPTRMQQEPGRRLEHIVSLIYASIKKVHSPGPGTRVIRICS